MNPTVNRGRLLLLIAATLLIIERLFIAGMALAYFNNWTSVILPLTHVAVVLFLLFTSDQLIYWLVILWGVITTGHFGWLLLTAWKNVMARDNAVEFSVFLTHNWRIVALIAFHLVMTLLFLVPSVRFHLAQQRSKLDFEDLPPAPPAEPPGEPDTKTM